MANSTIPTSVRYFGAATQAQQENKDQVRTNSPDPFWDIAYADDISVNWDKSFPYQLLLLRKTEQKYKIEDRFTLPIPPQTYNNSTRFAINGQVTVGGYHEEHNGAPLRQITIQGTTGVLPLRGSVTRGQMLENGASSIFAGTVNGVQKITTAASQVGNLVGTTQAGMPNVVSKSDLELVTGKSTGYQGTGFYQFQLLKRFLESYATRKKNGDKTLRLGFAVWKEKEVYLVTPQSFDVPRNAQSPLEYPYSISMQAWKRIKIDDHTGASDSYEGHIGTRDPNALAQVVNALETSRRVLEGARAVLEGVRADIQNVLFTPLRQTLLAAKDAVGVVLTAVDLPTDVLSDLQEPILEAASTNSSIQQLGRLNTRFNSNLTNSVAAIQEAFRQLSVSSGKADAGAGRSFESREDEIRADPASKVAENPKDNFEFFETIRPSDLNLRSATIKKIEEERALVQELRREDYRGFRDKAQAALDDFSDFIGAGDATYSQTYGLPARSTTRIPTDDEWEVIFALSEVVQQYDALTATTSANRDQVTAMDLVAGLASRSGIAFTIPRSKFAVPFPYGYTLEKLSDKYFGTPSRWHEIATLNGLTAPYVDEIGFKRSLIANGNGNVIIVASAENFYVGQKIWLSCATVARESRRIQEIKSTPTQTLITLDGDADLSKFTVTSSAYIQAFLPETVNSQQQIYLPSDAESDDPDDFRSSAVPGVDFFDPLTKVGGFDLLLTPDNDLIITPDGDNRLAVGLTGLIQRARIALGTQKGGLLEHPSFGLGLKHGTSTSDLTASEILADLQQLFRGEPGYLGVRNVAVNKLGGTLRVNLTIGIAGINKYIPIQVDIVR